MSPTPKNHFRYNKSQSSVVFRQSDVLVKAIFVSIALAICLSLGISSAQAQFPAKLNLSDLNGSNGFSITGFRNDHFSGASVSGAGDINDDGLDDLVIGAPGPFLTSITGDSYVFLGGFSGQSNLRLYRSDFEFEGTSNGGQTGASVSGAGDFNGDGIDDLIIGAPVNNTRAGESYVIFGKRSSFSSSFNGTGLNGTNGIRIYGVNSLDNSGESVSRAGDINGDGIDDLIIGAPAADPNGRTGAGESYVVFGKSGRFSARFFLSDLDGTNGFVINGITGGDIFSADHSGESVSDAGDINGDGIDDLIIGAPGADPDGNASAGESYVVFGSSNGFPPSLNLSSLNGANGFLISGISSGDQSGGSVSGAGDVNGDGIDDVIIGALFADPNEKEAAGASYVVFGSSNSFPPSLNLSSLNGTNGFVINGVDFVDNSGVSVSGAGDVNGDGIADLIIGARNAGNSRAGASYVVFGRSSGFPPSLNLSSLNGANGFLINGISSGDNCGGSVSGAGDLNGDGVDDMIIGASGAYRLSIGESYVVYGQSPSVFSKGDVNQDGSIDFLDIAPFIGALSSSVFQTEADIDCNFVVNFLDIAPFIAILSAN